MYKGRVWWGNRYQFVCSGNQASVLGHGIEGALLVTEQVIWSVILNDAASIQHHYSGGGGGGRRREEEEEEEKVEEEEEEEEEGTKWVKAIIETIMRLENKTGNVTGDENENVTGKKTGNVTGDENENVVGEWFGVGTSKATTHWS